MSTPRALNLDPSVRRLDTETDRGTFAALVSMSTDSALPRGSALLIPGFTGSKEDFAPLLPLLSRVGWNAASYDQRGQFESTAGPAPDFSLAGFAADAAAVSTATFGADEQVHVVGHSFGGLVAATAAIKRPERWASLTLMCSGPVGFGSGFGAQTRQDLLEAADSVLEAGLEAVYQMNAERDRRNGVAADPDDVEDFMHRRFVSNSAPGLAAIARLLVDTSDLTSALADLDLPVAVVRGESDDAWPHAVQDRLASALGTRVVVVPDAAHSPAVEQPEATRDALARIWLR